MTTLVEPYTPDMNTLEPACELLCVALKYRPTELKSILTSLLLDTGNVDHRLSLAVAEHVQTHASSVEAWSEQIVRRRTGEALVAGSDLVEETWFTDVFEHGPSKLTKHLFECYKSFHRSPHGDVFTPTAFSKDKSINVDEYDHYERLSLIAACENSGRALELVHSEHDQASKVQGVHHWVAVVFPQERVRSRWQSAA